MADAKVSTLHSGLYLQEKGPKVSTNGNFMDKDGFLKLLVKQLQYQDPLNPVQDKDFIAQMATLTSLEQTTNMTKIFEKMYQNSTNELIFRYSELIGKEVSYNVTEKNAAGEDVTKSYTGNVKSVMQGRDGIIVEMTDGKKIAGTAITQISAAK